MFAFRLASLAMGLVASLSGAAAQNGTTGLTFGSSADAQSGLQLAGPEEPPTLFVSADDFTGVQRAADDLAEDFNRVLGAKAAVSNSTTLPEAGSPAIIIGTIGKSALVDELIAAGKVDVSSVEGQWETFASQVVANDADEPVALVIAGSDVRGTIFGIYDVSEQIGVSPWYWWADVEPTPREYIFAPAGPKVAGPPSVKFRGIFLNDEAPGLTNWAAEHYPRSEDLGSPFNSDFYARVLELVLRLKGNYLWPAMWGSMFYVDDEKNGPLANDFGVFMGTSHHEPMARSEKEQNRFTEGEWDWESNRENVENFMTDGVERAKDWDTVYTLGMRGSGDAASETLTSEALEEVIRFQQETLASVTGEELVDIPQGWVMYKEVPGYWQDGMDVDETVTLCWTDDNRGNIRRIPTAEENERVGGSGMYYRECLDPPFTNPPPPSRQPKANGQDFDYVGAPRNYKWINTIQNTKTWEQMHLAYERGIRQLWIVNVGDLKPMELPTSHFMAMAYDMEAFQEPTDTERFTVAWAARQWKESLAEEAAAIMAEYGMLCARRKYEDLSITPFAFNVTNYDEAERNYAEWEALLERAQEAYDGLTQEQRTSFFEIVLHPVLAGKTVFEIYTKAAIGAHYAAEHSYRADELAQEVRDAFEEDQAITERYHGLRDGKWNRMLEQTHIGYDNWQEPEENSLPPLATVEGDGGGKLLGVGIQGAEDPATDGDTFTLLPVDPYLPPSETRHIDVFMREKGALSYSLTSDAPYVNASNPAGDLSTNGTSRARSVLTVDWAQAPEGDSEVEIAVEVTDPADAPGATVILPLHNREAPPEDFAGHVESNGAVSIEASHFGAIEAGSDVSYVTIPSYGRTLAGVKLWPVTAPSQDPSSGPSLAYPFYTYSDAENAKVTIYLSASENADSENANRYAVAVDGGEAEVVQPVEWADDAGEEPPGWGEAVTRNAWVTETEVVTLEAGEHEVRVWLLEPTMVVTKVVVDLGGVRESELGPPESFRAGAEDE